MEIQMTKILADKAAKMLFAEAGIEELKTICHQAANDAGWWRHPVTGENVLDLKDQFNITVLKASRVSLMHSELSECLEGIRKNTQSDKIPEFTSEEEELADTIIRILDYSGAYNLRLGEAVVAKLQYNLNREDHKISSRKAEGGKVI